MKNKALVLAGGGAVFLLAIVIAGGTTFYMAKRPDISNDNAPPDPAPKAGTKLQTAAGLGPMRDVMKGFTEKDPIKVLVGSVGRDDSDITLNVMVRNDAPCEVVAVEGVAYGFDAWGKPARLNKGGENYVAFAKEGLKIAPKGKAKIDNSLKHPDIASIAVAQVDHYKCADGSSWTRP